MYVTATQISTAQQAYTDHVNPQWVRVLELLQMRLPGLGNHFTLPAPDTCCLYVNPRHFQLDFVTRIL